MPARTGKTTVYLNVYDLVESNKITSSFGIGCYHSGVEVAGDEYTFAAGAGIFSDTPKQASGAIFRESIELGVFNGSSADARHIVNSMREEYPGSSYHLINRNCNCFANDFVERLLGQPIPAFVNRLAYLGSFVSCLLPPSMFSDSPVDSTTSTFQGKAQTVTTPQTRSFTGSGLKLGGSSSSTSGVTSSSALEDRRATLREAALRRFEKKAEE